MSICEMYRISDLTCHWALYTHCAEITVNLLLKVKQTNKQKTETKVLDHREEHLNNQIFWLYC